MSNKLRGWLVLALAAAVVVWLCWHLPAGFFE
jgi:hypothetical protein